MGRRMSVQGFRAGLFHLLDDPALAGEAAHAYHPDGLLLIEDGYVAAAGDYHTMAPNLAADVSVAALPGRLITPGFVDAHIHFPQLDIIGGFGEQLLEWLEDHAYPAEAAFADPAHAREAAGFFIAELLRNGTTSALVFGTSHRASVDALFEAALERNMRLIAGKSLMDRGVPHALLDTPQSARADTLALIEAWHGRGRLGYAVSPRYALSCSEAELAMAGEVLAAHEGVLMHTHLAENLAELEAVRAAFPGADDYLDVYDRFGLVTDRSVFAHGVHLPHDAFGRLAKAGSALAFCPTSNLFLGSGLFDLAGARGAGVKLGLGTDVGAGTSFSLLRTLDEAYKVGQLQGTALDPFTALYLATLGGARALNLGDKIGSFEPGKEADFVVLDLAATPLLARRMAAARTLAEKLFVLTILGDDRVVDQTWVMGRQVHARAAG
jgi:guanine deaminase